MTLFSKKRAMFKCKTARRSLPLLMLLAVAGGCPLTGTGAAADAPYQVPVSSESRLAADDVGAAEIVFVKRKPYSSDHYYTDIDNGTSPDRFLPDNGIYIYNVTTGRERPVITAKDLPGGSGFIGKISLSFDAKKVLFDFRESPQAGFRVWEVNIDGSGPRQVLQPPADEAEKVARWGKPWHTDDIHPNYLPDGGIIFSSTRCEHTVLCGGSAHLVAPVLHRMDADGGNLVQLSESLVSEFCPVALDDGRIMYHRWEYVDRGARVAKAVWTMNPDGSHIQEVYGLADDNTTIYMYPQPLPGDCSRFVCVGTCHYPQGGCVGAILLLEPKKGMRLGGPDPDDDDYVQWDDRYAAVNLTPHVFVERRTEPGWHFLTQAGRYKHDPKGTSGHLYTHPFPVSEKSFLVSFKANPYEHYQQVPNSYAIYLLGVDGSHRLVHADKELSCWHAMPVKARAVPPAIQPQINANLADGKEALCMLTNVYDGMQSVSPGEIKWLRINEAVPRYWDTGRRWTPSLSSSGWKAALWPRVQWGLVPVEEDGSAYFKVPANRNLFYQALDANFMEVQRERTYINYKPGETRSCFGCHGQRTRTGRATPSKAMMRPPSTPQPQPCDLVENGGDGRAQQVIHYPTDIQPILNAKCVSCHGNEKAEGGLRLTGDITEYYCVSYEELCKRQLAGPIIPEFTSFLEGDRGNYNGASLPPKSLGAHASELHKILTVPGHPKNAKDNHAGMLTEMERMVFCRWMDSNYQFYGTYYGRHHPEWANKSEGAYTPADFRRRPTFDEAISFFAPVWHR